MGVAYDESVSHIDTSNLNSNIRYHELTETLPSLIRRFPSMQAYPDTGVVYFWKDWPLLAQLPRFVHHYTRPFFRVGLSWLLSNLTLCLNPGFLAFHIDTIGCICDWSRKAL